MGVKGTSRDLAITSQSPIAVSTVGCILSTSSRACVRISNCSATRESSIVGLAASSVGLEVCCISDVPDVAACDELAVLAPLFCDAADCGFQAPEQNGISRTHSCMARPASSAC